MTKNKKFTDELKILGEKDKLITEKIIELNEILKSNTVINSDVLEHALQCLSCLNPVNVPLTLSCGHSICKGCFEIHSDPKSKDSLVFCEECQMETKNKHLKELKILHLISQKYKANTDNINKIKAIVNQ